MQISANDRIRIALIGAGGMGQGDARLSTSLPGVELVAVADLYDGRLQHCKEKFGKTVATTRDYREILARKDVDAVIIATPDHWHSTITVDALNAGKDVYCEKPMVQRLEDAAAVIDAQKRTGRILQIGSQYVSSIVYQKARDLFRQGAIGQLNMVEAVLDRNTAIGAWQYSIPPDASPATVDWDRFLGRAPKRPFDPVRFFRWRNYRDYGTGVAGDLFVHLLSGLHLVTGSTGPTRVYAIGGTRFWKDGRDVPDVMLATMDYPKTDQHPEFTLALRVNLASGRADENFGFRFVGSEGIMSTDMAKVELSKTPRETEPGLTIDTFPKAMQEKMTREYREKYARTPNPDSLRAEGETRFEAPAGYNAHLEHHRTFINAVRTRKPVLEDATYGFRAAGPALLTNTSYDSGKPVTWDPTAMRVA
jgi:predicted dehydrogenase